VQGIRLDPNTRETTNDRQFGKKKKLATRGTLCAKQWALETGLHLCLCCPFAKAVWSQILAWEHFDGILVPQQNDPSDIRQWWENAASKVARPERRRFNAMVIYYLLEPLDREERKNLQQRV
jgi:hypothetical protein